GTAARTPARSSRTPFAVGSLEDDDAAGQLARFQVGQRLLELVELVGAGDQFVELETPGPVEVDHHGNVVTGAGRAVATAENPLVHVHARHEEGRLGVGPGHAENDSVAAPAERVDGLADHRRVAHA